MVFDDLGARGAERWVATFRSHGRRRLLARFDLDLDLGCEVGAQPELHAVVADTLDRFVEHDLAAIDLDPLLGELVGHLLRGDRAEELALLTRLRGKRELCRLDLLAERLEAPRRR